MISKLAKYAATIGRKLPYFSNFAVSDVSFATSTRLLKPFSSASALIAYQAALLATVPSFVPMPAMAAPETFTICSRAGSEFDFDSGYFGTDPTSGMRAKLENPFYFGVGGSVAPETPVFSTLPTLNSTTLAPCTVYMGGGFQEGGGNVDLAVAEANALLAWSNLGGDRFVIGGCDRASNRTCTVFGRSLTGIGNATISVDGALANNPLSCGGGGSPGTFGGASTDLGTLAGDSVLATHNLATSFGEPAVTTDSLLNPTFLFTADADMYGSSGNATITDNATANNDQAIFVLNSIKFAFDGLQGRLANPTCYSSYNIKTDLALSLTTGGTAVALNDTTTLTLTVDNQSGETTETILVSAPIPAGFTFVSASGGTYNSSTGEWDVGTLAGSGSTSLTLTIRRTAITPDPVTFLSEITRASLADIDSATNSSFGAAFDDHQDGVADDDEVQTNLTVPLPPASPDVAFASCQAPDFTGIAPDGLEDLAFPTGYWAASYYEGRDSVAENNGSVGTPTGSAIYRGEAFWGAGENPITIEPNGSAADGRWSTNETPTDPIPPSGYVGATWSGSNPTYQIDYRRTMDLPGTLVFGGGMDTVVDDNIEVFINGTRVYAYFPSGGAPDPRPGRGVEATIPVAANDEVLVRFANLGFIGGMVFHLDVPGYDCSDSPTSGTSYGYAAHIQHEAETLYLGSTNDDDTTDISSPNADGDGVEDDGLTMPTFEQGNGAQIPVTVSGAGGYLQAWIDWDGDNNFTGTYDQIALNAQDGGYGDVDGVVDGVITLTVAAPIDATTSQTFARFRWSSTQDLDTTTAAMDGEVEDYALTIAARDWEAEAIALCPANSTPVAVSLIQNPDFEDYSSCPNLSSSGTINNADFWADNHPTGGQLMLNDPPSCFSPRPHTSWPQYTDMYRGISGKGWLGGHASGDNGGEGATNTLAAPILPGNTYVGHFGIARTDYSPPFFSEGAMAFYGVENTTMGTLNGEWSPGDYELLHTTDPTVGAMTWDRRTFSLTPARTWDFLRLEVRRGGGSTNPWVYFDDFQLYECRAPRDYSDAPTSGTSYGDANHAIVPGIQLGVAVTAETSGYNSPNANGDVDDGVTIQTEIRQGTVSPISVNVTQITENDGYLQGWIDWNGNGDFSDPGEQVATNLQSATAGSSTITVLATVPQNATTTQTFARFRWSTTQDLDSTTVASDGEVEDYALTILPEAVPTFSAGCVAVNVPNYGFSTYNPADAQETFGSAPTRAFIIDEGNIPGWSTDASNDRIEIWESGHLGFYSIEGGSHAEINANEVAALTQDIAGLVGDEIEWYVWHRGRSGTDVASFGVGSADGGNQQVIDTLVTDNTAWQNYTGRFKLPPGDLRFELRAVSSAAGRPSLGNLVDNFHIAVCPTPRDYTDAPATYGSADHAVTPGFFIGTGLTSEASDYGSANADGDVDDGVTIPALSPGESGVITVNVSGTAGYLQAWIDWNGNGIFDNPTEQIATDLQDFGTGTITIPVTVPANATTNQTFARFRWSSDFNIDQNGSAFDGEVEDYAVTFANAAPILSGTLFLDNGAGVDTAHDGLIGVTEVQAALSTIIVYDGSSNELATAIVNPDGTWSARLPEGYSGTVQVVTTAGAGYQTISEDTSGVSGVSNANPTDGAYSFNVTAGTSYTGLNIGFIEPPILTQSQSAAISPGQVVDLAHLYTATTSGTVNFALTNPASNPAGAFSSTIFEDANCDGVPEQLMPANTAVNAGDQICVIVRTQASGGISPSASYSYSIDATTSYTGTAISGVLSNQDSLGASGGDDVVLEKRVTNITQATPEGTSNTADIGDVLRYRLIVTNSSTGVANNVVINDQTPAYTSLDGPVPTPVTIASGVSCALTEPASNVSGYSGALQWDCTGTLAPGGSGSVTFDVKIAN